MFRKQQLSSSASDDAVLLQGRLSNLQRSVAALLAGAARIEREEATLRRAIETGRLPSMANSIISGPISAQALVTPAIPIFRESSRQEKQPALRC
jgi:hypothetical protein